MGLRREHLALATPGAGDLLTTIVDIEALGTNAAVTVDAGGIELRLVAPTASILRLAAGDRTGCPLRPNACWYSIL
jgi:hypothetical protein